MQSVSLGPAALGTVVEMLAVAMVVIALGIMSVAAIRQMIQLYRLQSLILTLLTALVALGPGEEDLGTRVILGVFASLIPFMLLYIIEPLLAHATVPGVVPWSIRLGHPFLRVFSAKYRDEAAQTIQEALPVWLEHGLSPKRQRISAVLSLVLIATAYFISFNLLGEDPARARGLAVSLTLLMLGIFTMISRQDLISQILGLLVMDHGLFLATVRVIKLPSLISTFIVSLFLYILITLVILVILLPELHASSATIEVADQKELRG